MVLAKNQELKKINVLDKEIFTSKFEELLVMDMQTESDIKAFHKKHDDLEKHYTNEWCEAYFNTSCYTDRKDYEEKFLMIEREITPIFKKYNDLLGKRYLASPASQKLQGSYAIYRRNIEAEASVFNEKNLPIEAEISQSVNVALKLLSQLKVEYQGQSLPFPKLDKQAEDLDRNVRKEIALLKGHAHKAIADLIDDEFDKLFKLRQQLAHNSGYSSYIDYRFKELKRLEWTVDDCYKFHDAVKKHFVPLYAKNCEQKAKNLGIKKLSICDMTVNFLGLPPVRLFENNEVDKLVKGCEKIFSQVDPELLGYFQKMKVEQTLDLEVRDHKRPGGFMLPYPVFELAGVFGNFSGNSQSLYTLLHEAGHAFHYFLSKDVSPYALQNLNSEVAEIGSMGMEFIGLEETHHYLGEEIAQRVKKDRLRITLGLMVRCAMVDEFQFWMYQHPNHTRFDRRAKWIELIRLYYPGMELGEFDQLEENTWQFIHIISLPFYYIDYAISEIQALNLWAQYKTHKSKALRSYKYGCSLSGSKSVKETFEAFGSKLCFDESVIGPLAQLLDAELF